MSGLCFFSGRAVGCEAAKTEAEIGQWHWDSALLCSLGTASRDRQFRKKVERECSRMSQVCHVSSEYCDQTSVINPLTPNDPYSGRTAPLTSKRFILYIYSTNTGSEYLKHGIYCLFFSSSKCSLFHNSNIFGSCYYSHFMYRMC